MDLDTRKGFTQLSNEALQHICLHRPTSIEIAVYLYILDKVQWRGKSSLTRVSISALSAALSIKRERVQASIVKWLADGFLQRERDPDNSNGWLFSATLPSEQNLEGAPMLGAAPNVGAGGAPNVGAEGAPMLGAGYGLKGFTGRAFRLRNNSSKNIINNSSISELPIFIENYLAESVKSRKMQFSNCKEIRAVINEYGKFVVMQAIENLSEVYLFDKVKCPHRVGLLLRGSCADNRDYFRGVIDSAEISVESNARAFHAKMREKSIKGDKNFIPTNQEIELFEQCSGFFSFGQLNEPEDIIKQAARYKAETYVKNVIMHFYLKKEIDFDWNNGGRSHDERNLQLV